MKTLRSKYTAKFKRDYVAWTAIVIFCLIVISEITLAVALPVYMYKDSSLAVSVRRLNLLESFDHVRRSAVALKSSDPAVQAEGRLLIWTLNQMADHLRNYSRYLTGEEIAILQKQLNEMNAVLTQLQKGIPFSKEHKLDYEPYINSVMKKSGVK